MTDNNKQNVTSFDLSVGTDWGGAPHTGQGCIPHAGAWERSKSAFTSYELERFVSVTCESFYIPKWRQHREELQPQQQ